MMPDGYGFGLVTGNIISPPLPGQTYRGGGDSKYVPGLLKHIHNQNEETVNQSPSRLTKTPYDQQILLK